MRPDDDTSPADASDEDLAKQPANPVASLPGVPFQSSFDFGGGFDNQPVDLHDD